MVYFYVIFRANNPSNTIRLRLRYDSPSQFLNAFSLMLDDFISSSGALPSEVKLQQATNN